MNKFINFEIERAEIIEENPDSQFATAKVQAFASDKNRHDMVCSEDVLIKTAPTIYNKPILYSIDKLFDDFGSHSEPDKTLIAGFVVPESSDFIRLEDGRLSLNVLIKLWKRYAPKAMEIFRRDYGKKKVSVEMELVDAETRDDGFIEMKNFVYSGICLLGDLLTEASPGASIAMLSFEKENKEYKEALKLEFPSLYDEKFIEVPTNIILSISKGLDLYANGNSKKYPVYAGIAKYILKNGKINSGRLYSLTSLLKEKKFKEMGSPSLLEESIIYMLCGGKEGVEWFNKTIEDIDKNIYEFGTIVTFPYTKISDINPALKGIKPSISLSQANAIAKQADAIGVDKEKNGWAIAIANFKKTHVVKNGVWIKKENENMDLEKEKLEKEDLEPEKVELAVPEAEIEKKEAEEEKEEEKEEEEKEVEKMNVDEFISLMSSSEEVSFIREELSKPKSEIDFSKVFEVITSELKKMILAFQQTEESIKKENETLSIFKTEMELKQFNFVVDSVLKEIEGSVEISQDVLSEMREKSKGFTLENIDIWKNECKASAFSFAIKDKKEAEEDVHQYALPWGTKEENAKKSLWD